MSVFLRSVTIKNFRGLEDARLDKLGRFNVLIGRNNSGKSSVFGALQFVGSTVNKVAFDSQRVLTDLDASRSLEIHLAFDMQDRDREDLLNLLYATPELRQRREQARNSPLMRQIEYLFKAPQGRPDLLRPHETRVRAEDGQWATVQRILHFDAVDNPSSRVINLAVLQERYSGYVLNSDLLNVDPGPNRAPRADASLALDMDLRQENQDRRIMWMWTRLSEYFRNAFFFDPFRHSVENATSQETPALAQDGSNLPQVLHTINSNDRQTFQKIERFAQAALPDVGELQTPLEGTATRVTFRRPAGGYEVRLHDMGGGIEQLLMAATVLLTTGDQSTLFLEEPESHLHAGAQRFLMEHLYSGSRQIFISTHSPTFVNSSRPRSLYRVTYSDERTRVDRVEDAQGLGDVLEDIGARNSDVLLSDAVLFVEGPSDGKVMHVWGESLGTNLTESNVTVLPMGGGEHAEGKARVRGEILEGLSEKSPVPHMFMIDRDERSRAEIEKLQQDLGDKVAVLERRELENYLLVPRAILEALRFKHSDDASTAGKLDNTSEKDVEELIRNTAEGLYGVVLLKRIRSGLEGMKGGLLPREAAVGLASQARRADLARLLRGRIRSRLSEHLAAVDVDALVLSERRSLDDAWSDPKMHLALAPGEEILTAVFNHFGSEYKKTKDSPRIARQMHTDEIAPEIENLLTRAVSLPT